MRFLSVLAVAVALVRPAAANPAAEQLFQDGRKLMGEGKLPEACDAFRRSAALEPRPGTYLNLADCEEKRGRIATAWEAFSDARAQARRTNDPRADEADRRAAALAPKLPYLAIKVSAAARAQAVTITRDDQDVPSAELDKEVAIDPGHYTIGASAAGKLPWKTEIDVAAAGHIEVTVPELAADPNAPKVIPVGPGVIGATPAPEVHDLGGRHLGLGAAVGFSSDGDPLIGARIPIRLGGLGNGSVRALPSMLYTHWQDPMDNSHNQDRVALGAAIEYVAPLSQRFAVAAGLGIGLDLVRDSYNYGTQTQGWGAARLSPTFHLKSVDLGLHLQLIGTKDRAVGLAELGVDYFFW